MKSFAATTLLAILASTISAQDTTGCDENYSGTFEIAPYNITQSIPAQGETVCNTNPIVTLKNGVLTDQNDRTGEVVANHQFQFDNPVQGPTTSGFCIYSNGSLALNGNAVFYGCLSGSFSNLYDISIGAQCHEIYIVTYPCAGSDTGSSAIASPSTTSSTSSTSSTPTTTSTTSTSTTPTPTPTPTPTTTSTTSTSSTPVAVPATSSIPVASVTPVPFPVGNSTTSATTASMATITSSPSSSSSSSSSTTSSTSTTPTTFKGAANIVAVGGKVVAVVAGIAAFALF